MNVSRRDLLQTALAGSAGVALVGLRRAAFAEVDLDGAVQFPFLQESQQRMIAMIAEHILPETDTPGAIEARVPQFIELMLSDWYTPEEREPVMRGLQELNRQCSDRFGRSFIECDGSEQVCVLEEVLETDYFQMLKQLTVFGYYTSEVGAQAELVFNPVAGRYATIDFDEVGRQWVQ